MNQVSLAARKTNEMTSEVLGAADDLLGHSADLDAQVDKFLQKIRAV